MGVGCDFGQGSINVERTVSFTRCGDDSQDCPPSSFPAAAESCQQQPQSACVRVRARTPSPPPSLPPSLTVLRTLGQSGLFSTCVITAKQNSNRSCTSRQPVHVVQTVESLDLDLDLRRHTGSFLENRLYN